MRLQKASEGLSLATSVANPQPSQLKEATSDLFTQLTSGFILLIAHDEEPSGADQKPNTESQRAANVSINASTNAASVPGGHSRQHLESFK